MFDVGAMAVGEEVCDARGSAGDVKESGFFLGERNVTIR
jgi:hypothetical protein